MKAQASQRILLRRTLLWTSPWVLVLVGVVVLGHQQAGALLAQVRALLVAGETKAATAALQDLPGFPWLIGEKRLAWATLEALEGVEPSQVATMAGGFLKAPMDFPLALIHRRAFDRGDLEGSWRVHRLAQGLGYDTVPLVAQATLIEWGRDEEARTLPAEHGATPGRLAREVQRFLEKTPGPGETLVRDRSGREIGILDAGRLERLDKVPEEVWPGSLAPFLKREDLSDVGQGSLRLSIDLEWSRAARRAFSEKDRGSIVLLDVLTGEILAAVSDERTLAEEGGVPAFEQFREPASISKLVTTVATRRSGLDPNAEIGGMTCRGHEVYAGEFLYCPTIAGALRGLDRAMALSCNVAFANLGVKVGRDSLLQELRNFGFDRPLGGFPGGRIVVPEGDERQLADLSIGLDDTELTPLHGALLAIAMVRGEMPWPTLVNGSDGRLGFHPQAVLRRSALRVIEPSWSAEVQRSMEAVARYGTGRGLAPWSFPIAMKTGTASHPRHGFHVNYIGVGPLPEPRIAFCVRITHQRTSRRVRDAARRVTRRLLEEVAELYRGGMRSAPSSRITSPLR